MAKPTTSYTKSTADAASTQWTLGSLTVTLNSILAYLNGYFTVTIPNQLGNKLSTAYAALTKNQTPYARNSDTSVGITAGDLVIKANSSTVQATGYTSAVPNMLGNKPLTTYAAV